MTVETKGLMIRLSYTHTVHRSLEWEVEETMPACQKCKQKWTWKQTFERTFTPHKEIICPYCNEKQFITTRTKDISGIMTFAAIIIMFLAYFLFEPAIVALFIIIPAPLFIWIFPYTVELSNKKDSAKNS